MDYRRVVRSAARILSTGWRRFSHPPWARRLSQPLRSARLIFAADALEFLLGRRLLLLHEFSGALIALGPGAFAHRLAAKLGALPDGALPGIITSGFIGRHEEIPLTHIVLEINVVLGNRFPSRRETNIRPSNNLTSPSVKRWPSPRVRLNRRQHGALGLYF